MDKIALQKGLQRVFYGILAAFIGPVVIMQAFQNEGHPLYWPVLLVGLLFFRLGFAVDRDIDVLSGSENRILVFRSLNRRSFLHSTFHKTKALETPPCGGAIAGFSSK